MNKSNCLSLHNDEPIKRVCSWEAILKNKIQCNVQSNKKYRHEKFLSYRKDPISRKALIPTTYPSLKNLAPLDILINPTSCHNFPKYLRKKFSASSTDVNKTEENKNVRHTIVTSEENQRTKSSCDLTIKKTSRENANNNNHKSVKEEQVEDTSYQPKMSSHLKLNISSGNHQTLGSSFDQSSNHPMLKEKMTSLSPKHNTLSISTFESETTLEAVPPVQDYVENIKTTSSCINSINDHFTCVSPSLNISNKLAPSPGLTLSAFRRPEVSVRLTDCPSDTYLHQTYHVNRVLGHGASSIVRLAIRRSDGKRFAVKCIPKYAILSEKYNLDEIALLKALNHPNIVSLVDVFETENEIQLVMEYCAGGDLFESILVKKTSFDNRCGSVTASVDDTTYGYKEKDAAKIILSLLRALQYLHSLRIIHRDVKPENVLLVSSENGEIDVKLTDFGTARVPHPREKSGSKYRASPLDFDNEGNGSRRGIVDSLRSRPRAYSNVGSDFYTAPEVRSGKGYDTSVDMYSLGVTMYIILFGQFPPLAHDKNDVHWKRISPEAESLLRSLLDHDPTKRITASKALRHDWIMQNAVKKRISSPFPKSEDLIRKKLCSVTTFKENMALIDNPSTYSSDIITVYAEERQNIDEGNFHCHQFVLRDELCFSLNCGIDLK